MGGAPVERAGPPTGRGGGRGEREGTDSEGEGAPPPPVGTPSFSFFVLPRPRTHSARLASACVCACVITGLPAYRPTPAICTLPAHRRTRSRPVTACPPIPRAFFLLLPTTPPPSTSPTMGATLSVIADTLLQVRGHVRRVWEPAISRHAGPPLSARARFTTHPNHSLTHTLPSTAPLAPQRAFPGRLHRPRRRPDLHRHRADQVRVFAQGWRGRSGGHASPTPKACPSPHALPPSF